MALMILGPGGIIARVDSFHIADVHMPSLQVEIAPTF